MPNILLWIIALVTIARYEINYGPKRSGTIENSDKRTFFFQTLKNHFFEHLFITWFGSNSLDLQNNVDTKEV